ncbi:MAG: long-chain fatty acid--CoA ligase [Lachnospiraceae bacterium]|nr:long-chain fatty acid--CoA ligase [Lachnospiraceae bacterium]
MKSYPLYKVKYYERFCDMVEDLGDRYGDAPAVSWYTRKQEEKGVTYRQMREDVRNLQEKLVDMGLAGRHIAIVGENSYEWIIACLAINYCGGVAVFIDTEQSDETIVEMLKMADTDVVFYSKPYEDICRMYDGDEKKMILLNGSKGYGMNMDALIEEGAAIRANGGADENKRKEVSGEDVGIIVFTSGTTSASKAVMHKQSAVLTNAADTKALIKNGPIVFTSLPFYHTYGWTCSVLDSLIVGAHMYINGNLRTVFRDMRLSGADSLYTVPLMLEMIRNKFWLEAEQNGKMEEYKKHLARRKFLMSMGIKKPTKKVEEIREKCFGAVNLVLCGGASPETEIMEEFELMGVTVLQGYGITECAPLVSANRNDANRFSSVGLVAPHAEVKIEDGEILVRGKNVMKGYYKNPELTAQVMKDGWFCTGDLGGFDKDGFLFITGRKKNLIVFKSGKKVSPEKLEEMVKKIPLVQDVMVYGAETGVSADDVQVAASIYPNQTKTEGMTNYEILEALQKEIDVINHQLPMYQQIRLINIREQEFSKTALKKIKRHLS